MNLLQRDIPLYLSVIYIDSCAFDPKYEPEDQAAEKIYQLYNTGDKLTIVIPYLVKEELEHPSTPASVKGRERSMVYTIKESLTDEEECILQKILTIIAGKGMKQSVYNDAVHIFEAQKYGNYFITADKRLLKKRDEIKQFCSLTILTPSEFLKTLQSY